MKIAIVTDSNSGITQKQAEELGIFVIPMPFIINGQTYLEEVDLSQKEFFERQEEGSDITTSQPSPESVMNLWDSLLKDYDKILHIPMSSGLSGSCQTARMLAGDYDGNVIVTDNLRISVTQRQAALDAKTMADRGMKIEEIARILEQEKLEASIYLTVNTLEYLKKGGRITPAAALLGTFLKIKPVLTIQGDKLDAFAKARTMKQAKSMMMTAIQRDLESRFGDKNCENCHMAVVHSNYPEAAEEFRLELKTVFPSAEIYVDNLSLSVACHVGPGVLALAVIKPMIRNV